MKVQVAVFATLLVCLSAATHLTEKVIAEELLKNMGFEEKPNMKKVWIFQKNPSFLHTLYCERSELKYVNFRAKINIKI